MESRVVIGEPVVREVVMVVTMESDGEGEGVRGAAEGAR